MRSIRLKKILTAATLLLSGSAIGQGVHFSQYYNAPLLLNPANTALMPESDYRVGINYRQQWAAVPVPYKTTSVYADFQAMRNRNLTNWLGIGLAFWNDKAGNGDLALTRTEALIAYHVQMGETSMLSVGASAGYVQRSVDFNKLTYDMQWDGFRFDKGIPNGESGYVAKTNFLDVAAGINYALFPNENVYFKIGLGVAHITQPKESFYGQQNKLGIRPTLNMDLLLKLSSSVILNPSLYYTTQKSASELLYGTLFQVNVSGDNDVSTQIILGGYHRWNEAVVGTVGLQYGQFRLMSSYDFTISTLGPAVKGRGAFELAIRYQGLYGEFSRSRQSYNCPRF